ncbi:unnamed protein product [Blepharisma stoltei]|uniref:Cilia-and flagella-associated protein 96 n=1 Tax=Blepharisma stoltei TaxID=1481888 RepID=A0AAU9IQW3_9CILI|nr:unnamed protein product [Blepharisma stoltei]
MTTRLLENPVEKEAEKAVKRDEFLKESKENSTKSRYGLFSFTGTLAISDDAGYYKTASKKLPDGTVKTGPKNFSTSPTRTGKGPDVYFSKPEFLNGDLYRDPIKPQLNEKERAEKMKKSHDVPFRPAGPVEEPKGYENMPTQTFHYRQREPDGSVKLEPRNFFTSPPKAGAANCTPGVTFDKKIDYIPDPYDRVKELNRQKAAADKAKLQDRPFKPSSPSGYTFSDFKTALEDSKIPLKIKSPKYKMNVLKHDRPFFPASPTKKNILEACFDKYPEHMSNPLTYPQRKSPSSQAPWKPTVNFITKPSPSVAQNLANIRAEFPGVKI